MRYSRNKNSTKLESAVGLYQLLPAIHNKVSDSNLAYAGGASRKRQLFMSMRSSILG